MFLLVPPGEARSLVVVLPDGSHLPELQHPGQLEVDTAGLRKMHPPAWDSRFLWVPAALETLTQGCSSSCLSQWVPAVFPVHPHAQEQHGGERPEQKAVQTQLTPRLEEHHPTAYPSGDVMCCLGHWKSWSP